MIKYENFMSIDLLIILIIIITGFILLYFLISRKQKESSSDKAIIEWLKTMQKSMVDTNSNITSTLQQNSKDLNERLDRAAVAIRDVNREIGEMSEIGRSMKELQDFLKSPKLRGNIGEEVLKDMISQSFPKNTFNLQYQFSSGEKVDAAIKTDAGILPIDSKFPMENFQKMNKETKKEEKEAFQKTFIKDVKKHIDDISRKYILPEEGTMDFCLMYIPSEAVYYEIVNTPQLIDYARKKRVYAVSPSTLYAHLQMILLSYEGKKIETKSREIFAMLRALQVDYDKVNENMSLLGKHLNNASNQFGSVTKSFEKIGNKIHKSNEIESEIDKLES